MAAYNFRVIKKELLDGSSSFGLHEVYYRGNGAICGYTVDPLLPAFPSREQLVSYLKFILNSGVLILQINLPFPGLKVDFEKWLRGVKDNVLLFSNLPSGPKIKSAIMSSLDKANQREIVFLKLEKTTENNLQDHKSLMKESVKMYEIET